VAVLFFAFGTWLIPVLIAAGFWRHVIRRVPLRYSTALWGLVFPLGMYTVCTVRLSQAVDAPYLLAIPQVFVFVALGAWAVTLLGWASSVLRRAGEAPS
jgi:tellurite resistance protein TehA-like permease